MPGCVLVAERNPLSRIGSGVTDVVESKLRTPKRGEPTNRRERVLKHVAISPRCPITPVVNTTETEIVNTPETTNNESDKNDVRKFVFPTCFSCWCEFTAEHYRTCPAVKAAEDAEDGFFATVGAICLLMLLSVIMLACLISINNLYIK